MERRAIGIVRVSQVAGREGASFASPAEQRERVQAACQRDNLKLLEIHEELDVSGGRPLDQRPGLKVAVEAVENGRADVIVAAYFDRLVRSLRVQDELVTRVEKAGGQVLAVDVGRVTNDSAGQWLSGTMLGAVSEYQRRTAAERTGEAQARAVARGVAPMAHIPPGYRRGPDGVLTPHPVEAPAVAEAFRMRADGATASEVRAYLAGQGIHRYYSSITNLFASRVVLGEIHFGELSNLHAHEPIVDVATWERVQRVRVSRGRRAKSRQLLARLGVLRCASCGGRMTVGGQRTSRKVYPFYRCGLQDCDRHVTISANIVEPLVISAVRDALAGMEGQASAERRAHEAEVAVERAQADLEAAIRAFTGLEGETAARERLTELRAVRDLAQERLEHLGGQRVAVARISAATDWDRLSFDEQRALIRATVDRVTVAPGKGPGRVTVQLFLE